MEMAPMEKDLELGLENVVGVPVSEEDHSPISSLKNMAEMLIAKVKGSFAEGSDDIVSSSVDALNSGKVNAENVKAVQNMAIEGQENKALKEKRKILGNKKPAKPPRPPRAPSLDAADQKLIRELAELARLKRARIDRMKALKKMNAAKETSSSSSNMFGMVPTVIFFLVLIFQGMPSKGIMTSSPRSPVPAGSIEGGRISVQLFGNPFARILNQPDPGSTYIVEQVAGLDAQAKVRRFSG